MPQQQKNAWRSIPADSRPRLDHISYQNIKLYINFVEDQRFAINIFKQLKIVVKALIEVKASPERDIWFLQAVFQG